MSIRWAIDKTVVWVLVIIHVIAFVQSNGKDFLQELSASTPAAGGQLHRSDFHHEPETTTQRSWMSDSVNPTTHTICQPGRAEAGGIYGKRALVAPTRSTLHTICIIIPI